MVALGPGCVVGPREHAGRHFLCRRLADAAGDADDRNACALAVGRGQIAVGADSIGDEDRRDLRFDRTGDERGSCAVLRRHGNEVMAVGLFALDRDEQIARLDIPGIQLHAGDGNILRTRFQLSVAELCGLLECQFLHFLPSKYDATTSRSSRWCFSCPIS